MSNPIAEMELLETWVEAQRWYAGKGSRAVLQTVAEWDLPGDAGTSVRTYLLADLSGATPTLYQVPISVRREPDARLESALIARVSDGAGADLYLYDAPHDPLYARQLLELATGNGRARGRGATAWGNTELPQELVIVSSRVLGGEQSNTSVVYELGASDASEPAFVVCKVFRMLHPGNNPDVELQTVLSTAGSERVPRSIGSVQGQWPSGTDDRSVQGHLAFAQEFLFGAEDAWQRAIRFAAGGVEFAAEAHGIGEAIADIHSDLAEALPTREAGSTEIRATLASWNARLDAAIAEVPRVAGVRDSLQRLYADAATGSWPPLQRIHGDLHLGQILVRADGSSAVIDFEGEPLRPMSERSIPDLFLRDIAGMLRSFDYIAGALSEVADIRAWTAACRRSFMDGYQKRSGTDLREYQLLLDALEADKAVYEAVYEARNRPSWLSIPTDALHRLVSEPGIPRTASAL